MGELSSIEQQAVERACARPMLDQVLAWSAINSGSRNLAGLEQVAEILANAFAAFPAPLRLEQPAPSKRSTRPVASASSNMAGICI